MFRINTALTACLYLIIFTNQAFAGPDYAREKRWADEIIPGLIVGEPVYLKQRNGHRFLSILAEEDKASTGLIIVHGMGIHPDWGMVSTLRQRLHDFGYTTLSIQMPVLAANASYTLYPAIFPDAVERLQVAVDFFQMKKYRRIIIVSHSNGSRMSRVYMSTNPPHVDAWAALSLTQGDTFASIKVPILDLYGSDDLPHVLSSVISRRNSLLNSNSKQIIIPGANHFFAEHEEAMVNSVNNFLRQLKY